MPAVGFYVSAVGPGDQEVVGLRVGANGSGDALTAVLFAGYSVTGAPDATRVRGRWWGWRNELDELIPAAQLPAAWPVLRSADDARDAIAYAHDGCSWLVVHQDAIARDRDLEPVTCPQLAALLDWYDASADPGGGGTLDAPRTAALADALTGLLPAVQASSWNQIVAEFAGVVRVAAELGGTLVFG